jgi:NAD(P)-dependent dehydrogenase (short-subunit alcohol dehydrogenase family)
MKKIIVTGTSRGIGNALALEFAAAGNQVLAISRRVASNLLGKENITNLSIDLGDEAQMETIVDFLSNNWKTVDCIIHNAGVLVNKPFAETTQSDFEMVYKTNVFGVANLTRIALPFLKKGSHVVAISSMGGVQGSSKFAGLAAYSSSKGALITLIELLAEEFKSQGIAFNVLALGAVNTEMLAAAFPGYEAPLSAVEMAKYIMEFSLTGNKFYNGKILEVSSSTP